MTRRRRTVRCWCCGTRRRRVPSDRGLRTGGAFCVRVAGRTRTVRTYGICPKCAEPLLLPADAAFVLRAAVAWERGGKNRRSEYA